MNFFYTVLACDDFIEEAAKCPMPRVAVFVAKWSGNCHMIEPIIGRLAKRFEGQIKFCNVDVDKAKEIARGYSITELPTVLFLANDKLQSRINGIASECEITKKIESLIRSKPSMDRDSEKSKNRKSVLYP